MAACKTCGKKAGFLSETCDQCQSKLNTQAVVDRRTEADNYAAAIAAQTAGVALIATQSTTAFELPYLQVTHSLGIVRGLSVRSPKIGQGLMAGLETIGGGENNALTQMCEQTRQTALARMWEAAYALGANAVIGCRYESNEISAGITEVLCYGTAVFVTAAE